MTSAADDNTPSTRPYLIRALHEWCTDHGYSPYVAVHVDGSVQVPHEFVNDNQIVLNVSFDATSGLNLGNDYIEFKARFGGVARDIIVPITHVVAIYARENGQGMAFPAPTAAEIQAAQNPKPEAGAAESGEAKGLQLVKSEDTASSGNEGGDGDNSPPPASPAGGGTARPTLKRVK